MNYLENFKYWLINRPIFEMAYYRKDAIDSIRSLSGTILIHFIKIKQLKGNINDNHWKNEVKSFFRKVNTIRIKPKNKKFTTDEYMNFLFIEPYCTPNSSFKKDIYNLNNSYINSIINEINYDYNINIKISDINIPELIDFFKTVSNKIELDEDYFEIIDNL